MHQTLAPNNDLYLFLARVRVTSHFVFNDSHDIERERERENVMPETIFFLYHFISIVVDVDCVCNTSISVVVQARFYCRIIAIRCDIYSPVFYLANGGGSLASLFIHSNCYARLALVATELLAGNWKVKRLRYDVGVGVWMANATKNCSSHTFLFRFCRS